MTGKNIRLTKFDSASVLHIPRASGGGGGGKERGAK